MAKVTITFEDTDDGLEVSSHYDPPLATAVTIDELSDAYRLGIEAEEIIIHEIETGFLGKKRLVVDFSKMS